MTVPGKGGRPRKWRSDADRVRAYRARQTGVDEPPVLAQALDDGDELARVWALVRQLGEQLDTANATIKQLRRERDQARRELERERHRWGWIESHNTELTAERDRLLGELGELRDRPRVIETPRPAATATPPQAPQPTLSRAERRRLEREQQRRRGR
jgi:chromosome segregation ATPase